MIIVCFLLVVNRTSNQRSEKIIDSQSKSINQSEIKKSDIQLVLGLSSTTNTTRNC